jgi:hypothetical protein
LIECCWVDFVHIGPLPCHPRATRRDSGYFLATGLAAAEPCFLVAEEFCFVWELPFLLPDDFAAGFTCASWAGRAFSSCACLSTAAALAGSVLMVIPLLLVCANAPDAKIEDIRSIKLVLLMFTSWVVG